MSINKNIQDTWKDTMMDMDTGEDVDVICSCPMWCECKGDLFRCTTCDYWDRLTVIPAVDYEMTWDEFCEVETGDKYGDIDIPESIK